MEYVESIINSINDLFDVSDGNMNSLIAMVSDIEKESLIRKFNVKEQNNLHTSNELISKANLLSALLEMILENPGLELLEKEKRKKILFRLWEILASLYEQVLMQVKDARYWENIQYLVLYSMLSYLADHQTLSDLVIQEYHEKLVRTRANYEEATVVQKLEFDSLYLIIAMMSNIKNQDGLLELDKHLARANAHLNKAQKEEMEKEELDADNGIKIGAYANIIYLTAVVKAYLFSGIVNDEDQDIYSVIDIYSYNAYLLLTNASINIKVIGHLLKYAYERVVENSIWSIAEKSPLIKKFINKNLVDGDRYIYSLLPSQRETISEVLTPKKSIVVTMPTSSGKSFLAEMQILFSIHNHTTDNFAPTVCYIVPTNALINQVKADLIRDFDGFDFNIETAIPCYDIDDIEDEILTRKHIDILVCTPEKLEALVRQNHPSIVNTRLVVMDEAHNLSDANRGSKYELVLSAIKRNMREASFLLLSPFICNASDISEWLADTTKNAGVVSVEWAPTKQYIGCNLLNSSKTESVLKFYKSARNQYCPRNVEIPLELDPHEVKTEMGQAKVDNKVRLCTVLNSFIGKSENVLVLCEGKTSTRNMALAVKQFFEPKDVFADLSEDKDIRQAIEIIRIENGEEDVLIDCLRVGICFHHSGLSSLVKETVENLIRNNKIKIVFATTTLAQGLNFPINTVIFDTLKIRGKGFFTNSEFWNIAGRAGRAYKDREGYIIVSYQGTQKKTQDITKKYIRADLEEIVSSLNAYFASDSIISLDYNVLKKTENAPILNLLQYINHILNISYDYNIDSNDIGKIRSILTDSFLYHSLSKQEGFVSAQAKLNSFVSEYVYHTQKSKREDLVKADELGISDISYTKVKSMVRAFINELTVNGDREYKASDILLRTKNTDRLAEIIRIVSRIPEIKIEMIGNGGLDAKSIAVLLMGWVNGDRVTALASKIKRENQSYEQVVSLCNGYLNSTMKSYMPWGINVYQNLSYDLQTENAKMLPSYIYYGVSSKEAVIVSKLGVPRFAVDNVLKALKEKNKEITIDIKNIEKLKQAVKALGAEDYKNDMMSGATMKSIVDDKII